MPISTTRPEYKNVVEDWRRVRDCIEGESALRRDISFYIPVPPGMAGPKNDVFLNGKRAYSDRYDFYNKMAEFPEIVSPTLNGILGLVHEKEPEIELPSKMQYLMDSVTPDGETLLDFWERATREVLSVGRFITLGEVYQDRAYLVDYPAESLINWSLQPRKFGGEPSMIILKECKLEPDPEDPYELVEVTYYRQLTLENGVYTVQLFVEKDGAQEAVELEEGVLELSPMLFGRTFDHIPIIVSNALDMGFAMGPIPLLPMSRRALSIFKRSADYNRSIYIKGDPQVVLWGVSEDDIPTEIGGGTIWAFENPEGKAQYLDIDGQGIPLQRQAIEDEYKRFADEVGMLLEVSQTGYESGEALRRRQALRQVTVKSTVINAAEAFEASLRSLGWMMRLPESEINGIKFTPNLDFTESMMTGQELNDLVIAKNNGAPLSEQTLHDLMRRRQLTDREFDDEIKLVREDQAEAFKRAKEIEDMKAKAKAASTPPRLSLPGSTK